VRLRHRQVDDGVDAVVGEHCVQVGVGAAAVLADERLRAALSRSVAPASSSSGSAPIAAA
jgi:hypothetical protein